ncbi:glutamyl-tRNA reductase [Magnetococcus marinus MC-1]|uniref:Glutamyl-tRNA reductase n=1 Tax=Magnetococcus marinus (strain ATCC BAA-1437 / JCM 17883 / MC-1) TaxID=156889 RepID=HEM1_MAGMM|nr:glutamyl-tRNA reductase [Magnetococcus marinus]A0LDT6.1 RecName: Full=Glutamyl-tRNA reductase; Short=GluTR [Magnetococcus marinus MC-1]ABK46129.1 glutamyl-tRNA reductase [Magnetococcus marinus MC-1]
MKLVVVGLNHKSAPVSLREKVAYSSDTLPRSLQALTRLDAVHEGTILSTCNRVEIYMASRDPDAAAAQTSQWIARDHALDPADVTPHLYTKAESEAVRHGFCVASSLDSMVLGEAQILGQMKQAYQDALSAGSTGVVLNRFFQHAFLTAKRVRTETSIAENSVSVASAAVDLAKRIFGDLSGHSCLLIGAGEMCELAARHLVTHGVKEVLVTNRTFSRAVDLAQQFDGHAFPIEALAENLHRADIVISSTGSTVYMVGPDMVKQALKSRRQRPIFLIDIAVPRDLDPEIGQVDSAFLYDMDDLNKIVNDNRQDRAEAAQAAMQIIEGETPLFIQWLDTLDVVPTIKQMRRKAEAAKDQLLQKHLAGWDLSDTDRQRVENLARQLVNKLMHDPTERLRSLTNEHDGDRYIDAARKLYKLDDD